MPADAGHREGFFDERAASVCDECAAEMFDPAAVEPVVELLADPAEQGRALEFGIGTGRIALPLTARGVPVVGIETEPRRTPLSCDTHGPPSSTSWRASPA